MVSLECIEHILQVDTTGEYRILFEEYGGLDFLEYLQSADIVSEDVYEQAQTLVKFLNAGDCYAENGNNDSKLYQDLSAKVTDNQFDFGLDDQQHDDHGRGGSAFDFFFGNYCNDIDYFIIIYLS
eukprot:TRINITY_DN2835_c0_g2_i1.p1 TRINITY_DN2835_c0_g2~~TRINITY_DN2835_c0_g2_i1.p1  ORF type:complete len:125 (-),score=14.68 TRINITY_DN2835_c0_g2_i1:44-418(-)